MKLSGSKEQGTILSDRVTGKKLTNLTFQDAMELMTFDGVDGHKLSYDRRKSFKKPANREWADGVAW